MKEYFTRCFAYLEQKRQADEVILASLRSETSDFCRFNQAKVRQLGSVTQDEFHFNLIRAERQCQLKIELSGDFSTDCQRLDSIWQAGQELIAEADKDPYILYNQDAQVSVQIEPDRSPKTEDVIRQVTDQARGLDFVGILANGRMATGFASSLGQINWYETSSFNLDWSLYHRADKAVKASYAGYEWRADEFASRLQAAKDQLAVMAKPAHKLKAGKYHTYFAPAAVAEILEVLNWGGFSLKKVRTKQSPLCQLAEGKKTLNKQVTLRENTKGGLAPHFDSQGFARPDQVTLIEAGVYRHSLTNARSAKEYGITPNGGNNQEMMQSVDLAAGDLPSADVLQTLGTGLYVNNLWYMNFSDRHSCRLTGMTRFATLWVENGEIVAPVDVMRFDDGFYEMFGPKLQALTKERSMIISNMTYDRRDYSSLHLPGALVHDFNLTL